MWEFLNRWFPFTKAEKAPDPKGVVLDIESALARTGNTSILVKPSRISYHTLRLMSRSNPIIRLCIDTLKHQVARTKWDIVPIEKEVDAAPFQKHIDQAKTLLKKPNENNETFRSLMEKVIEDLLVLDQADLELVRNPKGEIVELYALDGATIRPVFDKHGQYQNPAYVQYLSSNKNLMTPDAKFGMTDLIHMMQNPQTDTIMFGYGFSPIESIIGVATNYLNVDLYQGDTFEKGTFTDIILNIGEDVLPEQVKTFREYWKTEIQGNSHVLPIIGGVKNPQVINLKESVKDAHFMEYVLWLARIIVGAFGMSPQDIGLTLDQYKAEGKVQQDLSLRQGYSGLLTTLAEYINQEVIWEGLGEADEGFKQIKFAWIDVDQVDEKAQAEVGKLEIEIGARTINEYREQVGLEPIAGGDRAFVLSRNGPIYLDQSEELASIAIEQAQVELENSKTNPAEDRRDTEADTNPDSLLKYFSDANNPTGNKGQPGGYAYLDHDKIPHPFGGEYAYLAVGEGVTRQEYADAQRRFTKAARLAYSLATPEMVRNETDLEMCDSTQNLREAIEHITLNVQKNANAIYGVVNHFTRIGYYVQSQYTTYEYKLPSDPTTNYSSPLETDELISKSSITGSLQHGVLEELTKKYSERIHRQLIKMYPKLKKLVPKAIDKAKPLIGTLEESAAQYSDEYDGEFQMDLSDEDRSLLQSAATVGLTIGAAQLMRAAPQNIRETLTDRLQSMNSNKMYDLIDQRSMQMAKSVAQTMRDGASKLISRMVAEGKSTQDITKALQDFIGIDEPWRAERIARTEVVWAARKAADLQARSAEATTKSWQVDGSPCTLCVENEDAGTIGINEEFPNGDNPHPNCLCHENYSFDSTE